MTTMTGTSTIYNTTDGPLIIDRAGRILGGRERREDVDASASPVAGHIAAGRIVVIESEATEAEAVDASDEAPAESAPAPKTAKARRSSPAPTTEEA